MNRYINVKTKQTGSMVRNNFEEEGVRCFSENNHVKKDKGCRNKKYSVVARRQIKVVL